MAINQQLTDEVLLATLIAQNGANRGEIAFRNLKSCPSGNWNPATNGDAAREQAFEREMLSRPSGPTDTRSFSEQIREEGLCVPLLCRACEYGAVCLLFVLPALCLLGYIGINAVKVIQLYL